ncbi:substrate-binding domain-containing protein [Mesorhizobium ventifaucium]|uniref:Monosaccharide ABC transporter substrate-binding protein, CUT2 family n=1 Tax=Mesorhizobium ventifaucium TaxID=666020 RepID=A0ABM9DIY0_9HYPH|nr:substrate-binding domain-containing protein [Mesorhizobium ventifaucium]CAH2396544.1 Monosaccharide ABC transporter substrate-binding protein, CUT2 family [Mesorhizobium ventifaucium]
MPDNNTFNHPRAMTIALLAFSMSSFAVERAFAQEYLAEAAKIVATATGRQAEWTGPTSGPKAQADKLVVYVSADQQNGGVLGVGEGVKEAAKAIGWEFRLIDGRGTVSGRTAALNQAIALKPSGIILGSVDAKEIGPGLELAKQQGITVVGWHSLAKPGSAPEIGIFTNLATDANDVATAAASYVINESKGKAGVVIYTDSTYDISIVKSNKMKEVIERCGECKVLELVDTPLSDTSARIPPLTTSFLQKYGEQWTHTLGINDLYFDAAAPALRNAGLSPAGRPRNISAGDGSIAAFQRIREKQFQAGTVAEPLSLHGWQAVDELNRAFAGQPPSGFVAPVHLVTPDNIADDGGPKNLNDPDNGYRDAYRKLWGKN